MKKPAAEGGQVPTGRVGASSSWTDPVADCRFRGMRAPAVQRQARGRSDVSSASRMSSTSHWHSMQTSYFSSSPSSS